MMETALWFSGGKDSMACLYLNEKRLADIHVVWGNTGKNYPELLHTVERAKLLCPNWHEVRVDRDKQWARNGLPSDVVPIDWTVLGQMLSSPKEVTIQSYLNCCYENIMAPVMKATRDLGATTVIRGQRLEESHRSPARNGDVFDGIRYEHPIEDWTKDEVLSYLAEKMGTLPAHFMLEHSSMDCFDCTAYRGHSADRIEFMKAKHPAMYAVYLIAADKVASAVASAIHEENA